MHQSSAGTESWCPLLPHCLSFLLKWTSTFSNPRHYCLSVVSCWVHCHCWTISGYLWDISLFLPRNSWTLGFHLLIFCLVLHHSPQGGWKLLGRSPPAVCSCGDGSSGECGSKLPRTGLLNLKTSEVTLGQGCRQELWAPWKKKDVIISSSFLILGGPCQSGAIRIIITFPPYMAPLP